ncbi:MAG TPA: hypothetical protein VKU41_09885 [Polyangiaceae bacterium]|nr:hypothetical protein [Polyangiaceae bacterium]
MNSKDSLVVVSRLKKSAAAILCTGLAVAFAACSTSNSAAPACADGGGPASGPADTHCGSMIQPTMVSSCDAGAPAGGDDGSASGDDGGGADDGSMQDALATELATGDCEPDQYGPAMYGTSGGDDDCKYDVSYSVPPICEGNPGVYFMVTVKSRVDGSPVTGANVRPDVVLNCTLPIMNHPADPSPEGPPGTYKVGPVVFQKAGRWVVRFHIHEECLDLLPTSQHGHASFWVDVP